jgi:hypothetical protein
MVRVLCGGCREKIVVPESRMEEEGEIRCEDCGPEGDERRKGDYGVGGGKWRTPPRKGST